MPELPEVETVCRGLEPALAGRRIAAAEVFRKDLRWPLPPDLAGRLSGARFGAIRRRSKYLLLELSTSETLIIHLGMSGRIRMERADRGGEDLAHDHFRLELDDGLSVIYNDVRRFGMIDLAPTDAVNEHRLLRSLGPEPLGNRFSEEYLSERLSGRSAPIKAVLLDQRVVAGLGNIYACEALWRSGISPRRRARSVAGRRVQRLHASVRSVLVDAIAAGGSSLRDYRQAGGEPGYFQHEFAVYGREGANCRKDGCGGSVRRILQSGRSSFFCPGCQG